MSDLSDTAPGCCGHHGTNRQRRRPGAAKSDRTGSHYSSDDATLLAGHWISQGPTRQIELPPLLGTSQPRTITVSNNRAARRKEAAKLPERPITNSQLTRQYLATRALWAAQEKAEKRAAKETL